MGKSYLFISGKGGVGKSTLSAALAVFAAQSGKRVVIIDGDMGLRSLDLMLGLQDLVLYDMADLVKRRCALDQTLIKHPDFPTLHLMVGGQQARPKDFNKQDVQKILRTLKKRFDLVLVDGPAGLGRGVRIFAELVDEVFIVATPDPIAIRSAEKMASQLYAAGARPQMLLNRMSPQFVLDGAFDQPQNLSFALDIPLLGVFEESKPLYEAALQGKTAAQAGDEGITAELQNVLHRMEGEDLPLPEYKPEKLNVFQRIWKWLED